MVPAITPRMPYAADKDFSAITLIGSVPQVVVVPASSPAKTLAEFIELAKARKGALNYASSGQGTQQHFAAEMFQLATAPTMTHVPTRAAAPRWPT
jgi:tripartite-type tricarboxylate transporter receptor subunit TctC